MRGGGGAGRVLTSRVGTPLLVVMWPCSQMGGFSGGDLPVCEGGCFEPVTWPNSRAGVV